MDKPKRRSSKSLKLSNIPLIASKVPVRDPSELFLKPELSSTKSKRKFIPKSLTPPSNITISVSDPNILKDDIPIDILVKAEPITNKRKQKIKQGEVFIGNINPEANSKKKIDEDVITPQNPISNLKHKYGPITLPLREPNVKVSNRDIFNKNNKSVIKLPSSFIGKKDKIGKLRYHKSGRVTIIIDNILYNVQISESMPFLQTVYLYTNQKITEISASNQSFTNIGVTNNQIVATPEPSSYIDHK